MLRQMSRIFRRPKPVIAMLHTGPTPGAVGYHSVECSVERAVLEARVYIEHGVDALLLENMHDFPCVHEREQGPEVAAFMTRVLAAVKRHARATPVGVQVLFQANRTALAVALAGGGSFIRAEGWTHAHVSDKGIAEASAGATLRYRKQIGADHLPVFADVKKKHASHAWTADLSIADVAAQMELHRADGLVVTGSTTGEAPDPDELAAVREATHLPVLVGSGVDAENLADYAEHADGFIIGSTFKERGAWNAPVCEDRVAAVMDVVSRVRRRADPIYAVGGGR